MRRRELPNRLYVGLCLSVYMDAEDGERYEFEGELIEPSKSNWRTQEPYLWEEGRTETSDINAVKEIWKVRVKSDSPFENGRVFIRHIPRFHSRGYLIRKDEEE